jgi:hypothetical protein
MRLPARIAIAACGLLCATTLSADVAIPQGFAFAPQPRWAAEPETEELCTAIARECSSLNREQIDTRIAYDEFYDAKGFLIGLRMTRSTGCKPLDESSLLGQAEFRLTFRKPDRGDLDDNMRIEFSNGVRPEDVRIVKSSETTISLGCGS